MNESPILQFVTGADVPAVLAFVLEARAQNGSQSGHQNRAKPQQAGFTHRVHR